MKIVRGNREYILTATELFEAHKEFMIESMREELEEQFGVPKAYAIEYAEKAYERYSGGYNATEYDCIMWAAEEYKKKYGKVA